MPLQAARHTESKRRRRRKPGLAETMTNLRLPSAPAQLGASPNRDKPDAVTDEQPTEQRIPGTDVVPPAVADGLELSEEEVADEHVDEPSVDELVAYADDVFAGRIQPVWHRVYPAHRHVLLTPTRRS
jgi:hypothetical protein